MIRMRIESAQSDVHVSPLLPVRGRIPAPVARPNQMAVMFGPGTASGISYEIESQKEAPWTRSACS